MSSLPPIFVDLAVILITAGVITVVFKWLKQPLVLGYIVAGFFIGPYFPWFPAVTDESNVHVWSDYENYDPEGSTFQTGAFVGFDYGAYPNPFTATVGVNLSF